MEVPLGCKVERGRLRSRKGRAALRWRPRSSRVGSIVTCSGPAPPHRPAPSRSGACSPAERPRRRDSGRRLRGRRERGRGECGAGAEPGCEAGWGDAGPGGGPDRMRGSTRSEPHSGDLVRDREPGAPRHPRAQLARHRVPSSVRCFPRLRPRGFRGSREALSARTPACPHGVRKAFHASTRPWKFTSEVAPPLVGREWRAGGLRLQPRSLLPAPGLGAEPQCGRESVSPEPVPGTTRCRRSGRPSGWRVGEARAPPREDWAAGTAGKPGPGRAARVRSAPEGCPEVAQLERPLGWSLSWS